MRNRFHTISDGQYANLLYKHFGKKRVLQELEEFFALPMVPRYGGGIGVTRLMKNYNALKKCELMPYQTTHLKNKNLFQTS